MNWWVTNWLEKNLMNIFNVDIVHIQFYKKWEFSWICPDTDRKKLASDINDEDNKTFCQLQSKKLREYRRLNHSTSNVVFHNNPYKNMSKKLCSYESLRKPFSITIHYFHSSHNWVVNFQYSDRRLIGSRLIESFA